MTPRELEIAAELYSGHAGPSGMEYSHFESCALEALGYSFLCRKRSAAAVRHLRMCSLDGRLSVNECALTQPLFERMWGFFSPSGASITMSEFARGLYRACGADENTRRQFLYYMISGDATEVDKDVLGNFLLQLAVMRGRLNMQVLAAERPFMMHQGVPGGTITRQIAEV